MLNPQTQNSVRKNRLSSALDKRRNVIFQNKTNNG